MKTELKPCPFCGGEKIKAVHGKWMWWCKCGECGAESAIRNTKAEAIEAWNRRANE